MRKTIGMILAQKDVDVPMSVVGSSRARALRGGFLRPPLGFSRGFSTRGCRATSLVVSLAVIAMIASQASGTDIEFRPSASVHGPTVLLKDVAVITGSDPKTVEKLQNVALAPAPAPGRPSRLDFASIRSRLEATGVSTADLNYAGSSNILVSSIRPTPAPVKPVKSPSKIKVNVSPAQVRRAEQILSDAVRHLLRTKSREAGKHFVEVLVDPSDVPAVLTGVNDGFEIGAIDPQTTEPQNVEVRMQDVRRQTVIFQIQCVISERPQVPVLNRSISVGEVIRETDLDWKQVDDTQGLVTHIEDIVEKEAKKGLHVDEPVHTDDVRTVPLVRANDFVTGIWRKGGICITAQFKSRTDGGRGDVIELVKLMERQQVMARVTDLHEAEILGADELLSGRKVDGETGADSGGSNRKLTDRRRMAHKMRKPPQPVRTAAASQTDLLWGGTE